VDNLRLRFVSGHDIAALGLQRAEILAAVTGAVRAQGEGKVVLEPRMHLTPLGSTRGHFNVLRGHLAPQGVAGVKVVGDFVDNHLRGLPSELALVTLFDPETGIPLAVIDGTMVTDARTGALTALGARHLARPDSAVLGHVGARGTAWWNVTMLDDLFDFDEIRVTSRRPESREAFGAELEQALGKPVRVVASAEEAVAGADIVVEATRLVEPEPLVRTEWIEPGTLTVPYGTMSAVELSLTSVMDKIVVDDWEQCRQGRFGSLRAHVERGLLSEDNLHAELGQIVAGARSGREREDERILFWHRGLATTDLAVGQLLYERAAERGVGTLLHYR
jgi:alanine dehydrogenase